MAWSLLTADAGIIAEKVADTTLARAPTVQCNVGDIVVVTCTTDNIATTSGASTNHTVTDASGNTWVRAKEWTRSSGVANDGITVSVHVCKVTTAITTSTNVTLTTSATTTTKTLAIHRFAVAAGKTFEVQAASAGASGNGTAPSVAVSGLASQEWLLVGGVGLEGEIGTITKDADYTQLSTQVSSTAGTADTNNVRWSYYRIATLTADTMTESGMTTGDWSTALVVLKEIDGVTAVGDELQAVWDVRSAIGDTSQFIWNVLGLAAQYDAQAIGGLANADPVSTWIDDSGDPASNLTQGIALNQPTYRTNAINGHPAVRFLRSRLDYMKATGTLAPSQPFTVVMVLKLNGTPESYADQTLLDGNDSTDRAIINTHSGEWRIRSGSGGVGFISSSGAVLDNNLHIVRAFFNGSSSFLEVDGTQVISGTTDTEGLIGLTIGVWTDAVADGADMDLGEVRVYNEDISSRWSSIESALEAKWGGLTAVGDELQALWDTRAAVGDPLQLVWDVRAPVGDTAQLIWNVRSALGDNIELLWDVLSTAPTVGDNLQLVWNTREALGDPLALVWNTRQAVGDPLELPWNVRQTLGDPLQTIWDVRAAIGDTSQLIWNVRAPIGDPLQLIWNTRQAVGDPLQLIWNVEVIGLSAVGKDAQLLWNTRSALGDPLQLVWHTKQALGDPLALQWDTRQALGDPLALQWNVRQTVGDSAQLLWNIKQALGDSVVLVWDVQSLVMVVGDDLILIWNVRDAMEAGRISLKHRRSIRLPFE